MAVAKSKGEGIYQLTLISSPPPHIHAAISVDRIVHMTIASLLPGVIWLLYLFGWQALRVMVLAVGAAILTEMAVMKLRGKENTVYDGTAVVTGLILAFTLPPTAPSWIVVLGAVIAIALGKQVFGGTGCNPFNPAIVGRVFLGVAFPTQLNVWIGPHSSETIASPLELWVAGEALPDYGEILAGTAGSFMGEFAFVALLLGGLILILRGYVDWRVPVGLFGAVAVFMACLGQDPLWHLLTGGVVLGAFYLAGDPVTNPITPWGRLVFGIGVGLCFGIIRYYGQDPDALFFAILLMNGLVPLLNRFLRSRRRGAAA
ncbi:MAG: RnfABCDGE type electron transport complex subunit D [Clostridia bacterium]|jgi:electron transport complex protein RnfD|nr:RnfABCDGE type electron transport complex subunit D [Clostridia bacterium]